MRCARDLDGDGAELVKPFGRAELLAALTGELEPARSRDVLLATQPLAGRAAVRIAPPELHAIVEHRRRILFVHDGADATAWAKRILSGTFVVDTATGASALAAMQAHPGYDAILVEVALRGEGGPALLRRLRREAPRLAARVVFMSTEQNPAETWHELGELDAPVLIRPFTRSKLLGLVRDLDARSS
jgi:CheY-like chemotaxis protein